MARLKVTFPDSVNSHTRQQISCFGPDGLLRRHDFTIDIIGGATGMLYATDYATSRGSLSPPLDGATPGRAITNSSPSRFWWPSTWARSPSSDFAGRPAPM